jgi:hypothetical protein
MRFNTRNAISGAGQRKRQRQENVQRQPMLENLENRQMFAVIAVYTAPDMVQFTSNAAADTIDITDDGMGTITATATSPAGVVTTFGPYANIRNVIVDGGGGADTVNYEFTGDLLGKRRITVDLGTGADTFNLDASADIDLPKKSRLDVSVRGGADNSPDDLSANYQGEMDGGWRLNMTGGGGNDTLLADVLFDTDSKGKFSARLIGGTQADVIDLLVRKTTTADPILINANASGGAQFDVVTRTNLATNDASCEVVVVVP